MLIISVISAAAVFAAWRGKARASRKALRSSSGAASGTSLRSAAAAPARTAVRPRAREAEGLLRNSPGEEGAAGSAAAGDQVSERAVAGVDLSCLEPPPDGSSLLEARRIDLSASVDILSSAEALSNLVCRRTVILKAMSGLSQEPREVSKLVVADPALAGQVLKTVNSAFYGLAYPVASVFRAVLLLGHLEVRNIIWRSCMSEGLGPDQGPAREALDTLWQHSFAASRVAYALARSLGLPAPDDVSTAALLHDIGKVFCLKTKPVVGMSLYGSLNFSALPKLKRELNELAITHASLGGEIARVWGLPEESRLAIGLHHMPSYVDPAEIDGDPRVVGVIYLADTLCHSASRTVSELGKHPIYLPRQAWFKTLRVKTGIDELCTESVLQALMRPVAGRELTAVGVESLTSD